MSGSRDVSDGLSQAPEKSNFLHTCNLLSRYIKEKGSLRDLNLEIGGKVKSLEAIVKSGSSLSSSMSTNSERNPGKPAKQISSIDPSPRVSRSDHSSSVITIEDSSNKTSTSKEGTTAEPKHSQLTIFYSGRVLVFDDYPADRARELVSIAKKSSSQMYHGILLNTPNLEKPNPSPSNPREGLPPRPHPKQPVGITSNTGKEKSNPITSGAAAGMSSPSPREGLPPRPGSPGGNEKERATAAGAPASAASSSEAQASPAQSEANGSDLPIARRSSLHRFLEKRKDRAAARGPYQHQDRAATVAGSSSSKGDEHLDLNL